jgi:hypothetical protein
MISDGLTGADRAGLAAARAAGLETGDWMPRGFFAEDANHPELADEHSAREHRCKEYPPRTRHNVIDSDGTIRSASNWQSRGTRRTLKEIQAAGKPHLDIDVQPAGQPAAVQHEDLNSSTPTGKA